MTPETGGSIVGPWLGLAQWQSWCTEHDNVSDALKESPWWCPCAVVSQPWRWPDLWIDCCMGKVILNYLYCFELIFAIIWSWKHHWYSWLGQDWLLEILCHLPSCANLMKKEYSYKNYWLGTCVLSNIPNSGDIMANEKFPCPHKAYPREEPIFKNFFTAKIISFQ